MHKREESLLPLKNLTPSSQPDVGQTSGWDTSPDYGTHLFLQFMLHHPGTSDLPELQKPGWEVQFGMDVRNAGFIAPG